MLFRSDGGDEFCAFVSGQIEHEILVQIAERIIHGFQQALQEHGFPPVTTVSIGIAIYDGSYDESFAKLYNKADKALYLSKNNGKNMYTFFE